MNEQKSKETPSVKKPKWLKILEKQSWQAELIISGLAILGSLQLPEVIRNLEDYAIFNASENFLELLPVGFMVLYIIAQSLIVGFLLHFIMRAFWIGMLGLVSAFPNGINWDFKTYLSPHFLSKLKEDLPEVDVFNKKLDDFCSLIFSMSSLVCLMYLPIMMFTLLVVGISGLINKLLPNVNFYLITLVVLLIVLAPILLANLFHIKKLRDLDWVKKTQFPLYKWSSLIVFNLFYLPYHYIIYILQTNVGQYKFAVYLTIPLLLVVGSAVITMDASNAKLLRSENYHSYQNKLTQWYPNQYEEDLNGETPYGIMIPSYEINEDFIKLFVPFTKRENSSMERLCDGFYEVNEDFSILKNDSLKWEWRKECLPKYFKIYVNDVLQHNLEFLNHKYNNTFAKGYLTFLSTENCKVGKNEIRVVTAYDGLEDGKPKQFRLPFRYHPKRD